MSFINNYVDNHLRGNEEVIVEIELHWICRLMVYLTYASAAASAVAGVVYGLAWLGYSLGGMLALIGVYGHLQQLSMERVVTSQRVINKSGVIARCTQEYSVARIESAEMSQSIMGRILGYADIAFIGTGSTAVIMPAVANYHEVLALNEE